MNRQRLNLTERLERAERLRKQKVTEDVAKLETYRNSFGKKADDWLRIIFFIQVFFSFIGFIFFPFGTVTTIHDYSAIQTRIPSAKVVLDDGRDFDLLSYRVKDLQLLKGDIITVEKNIFYKDEAISVKRLNKTFFLKSKTVWVYIQLIFILNAIVSMTFKKADDLRAKRRITVFLFFVVILYFFL